LTQPLDVAVFAPLKRLWRDVLDQFKEECAAWNIRNITIPKVRYVGTVGVRYSRTRQGGGRKFFINTKHFSKDKFGGLLRGVLEKGAEKNAINIKSGFAACGIYHLSIDKILSRLPPDNTVAEAKEHFSQQLTAELKRNRFGDPQKSKRAKKANRVPAGLSYTVSAVSAAVEEPVAGKYRYLPYVLYRTVPH
jgi:hypothetical protein